LLVGVVLKEEKELFLESEENLADYFLKAGKK